MSHRNFFVLALLASCGGESTTPPDDTLAPALRVDDGNLTNPAELVVDAATVDADGWVAVWHEQDDVVALAGAVYLTRGAHENIVVALDPPVDPSEASLRVSLHVDAPADHTFTATDTRLDGDDPVVVNAAGQAIVGSLAVTVDVEPNTLVVADQTITQDPPKVTVTTTLETAPAYVVLTDLSGNEVGNERIWDKNPRAYPVSIAVARASAPIVLDAALFAADGQAPDRATPIVDRAGDPIVTRFTVTYRPDNTLDVRDQTLTSFGYKIDVASIDIDELPAWVVVYEDQSGAPGAALGHAAIDHSPRVALGVDLTRYLAPHETVWVALRKDLVPIGTLGAEDVLLQGADGDLLVAIEVTNDACDGLVDKFCDPAAPNVLSWHDRCGAPSSIKTPCEDDALCDDSGPYVRCVAPPDPCAGVGGTTCFADDPSATWFEDRCGTPLRVATRCSPSARCEEGASGASCVLSDLCEDELTCVVGEPCDGPSRTFCDPAELDVIKWIDGCGRVKASTIPCGAGYACVDDGEPHCAALDTCGGNAETVCVADDPHNVYWVDGCGALTGSTFPCGVASCDDSGGAARCTVLGTCADTKLRVCDAADPTIIRTRDGCGADLGVFATCGNGKRCMETSPGDAACACTPTDELTCFNRDFLYEPSGIRKMDSCGNPSGPIVTECPNGQVCYDAVGEPRCTTSLSNLASPMAHRGCSFIDFLTYKTDLDVDCRCRRHAPTLNDVAVYDGGGNMACAAQADSWARGWTMGAGPHFRHLLTSFNGGGVYSATHGELFATKHFTDPTYEGAGMVVGYDIHSGARRIVSGRYPDEAGVYQMFGSGYESVRAVGTQRLEPTTLPGAWDLELGSDGMLYVWGSVVGNNEITRVDPDDGTRTLVWRQVLEGEASAPFGQCFSTRPKATYPGGFVPLELEKHAFARGPDGAFYLGFRNESAEGNGVVRIAADGSTCTVLTRWNGTMGVVGSGPEPQYSSIEGFGIHAGKLYASLQIGKLLLAVDLATGARTLVANPAGSVETTPGQSTMFWDATRNLLITAGGVQSYTATAIDLATGRRQSVFLTEPGALIPSAPPFETGAHGAIDNGNYLGYGAFALDPDDNDHAYLVIKWGLLKYELSTGNSYVMSQ